MGRSKVLLSAIRDFPADGRSWRRAEVGMGSIGKIWRVLDGYGRFGAHRISGRLWSPGSAWRLRCIVRASASSCCWPSTFEQVHVSNPKDRILKRRTSGCDQVLWTRRMSLVRITTWVNPRAKTMCVSAITDTINRDRRFAFRPYYNLRSSCWATRVPNPLF